MLEAILRQRIQNDPYYRFQSAKEIRIAAQLGIRINVNQACIDDWLRLPGLSIHQARGLEQLLQAGMAFYSLTDLAAALGVPAQRIHPWEPILSFQYFDPRSLEARSKLNLNTATLEELHVVLSQNGDLSRRIVEERSQRGRFQNFADFQARLQIPVTLLSELIHLLKL